VRGALGTIEEAAVGLFVEPAQSGWRRGCPAPWGPAGEIGAFDFGFALADRAPS
jgi:hypothetical protein